MYMHEHSTYPALSSLQCCSYDHPCDLKPSTVQLQAMILVQGFFGSGYFMEDKEDDAPNYLRSLERKKVLSNIERLGLLSAAEKAGLSLSKVSYLNISFHPSNLRCLAFPHYCGHQ